MHTRTLVVTIALAGSIPFSVGICEAQLEQGSRAIQEFMKGLPDVEPPVWNEKRATELVALPLSCVDRLHKQSKDRGDLYERSYSLDTTYEDSLSFYGCREMGCFGTW